ncbi:glycosyltransferase [Aquihabitans sp. G128]|uniref:glycosyltransferase n=1 Tax=Aquihabitans sp. G128 TaxID=2849779 RepID=UPI001C229845|nr:glycosyltransferase [Aquihabitans sp. G128]QXC59677.1 glycosyltransferase [Aquihabitans sp. G128]
MHSDLSVSQSAAFVLLVWFLAYVAAIIVPFLRRRPVVPGRAEDLDFHVFVPCLDEEAVIGATIRRIRASFGSLHVWVVDDASADGTLAVVEALAAKDADLHVVRRRRPEAQQGKGEALNSAYRELDAHLRSGGCSEEQRQRTVVTVLDADGRLDHDALSVLASASVFGDPTIGAAQIRVAIANTEADVVEGTGWRDRWRNARAHWLLRCQDIEFQTSIAAQQTLRLVTGSAGLGGNGQFTRLSVLDRIVAAHGGPWHGSLLEDYELGIHTILAGARTTYVHDTAVRQQALPTVRPFLRQRTRWAQGGHAVRRLPAAHRAVPQLHQRRGAGDLLLPARAVGRGGRPVPVAARRLLGAEVRRRGLRRAGAVAGHGVVDLADVPGHRHRPVRHLGLHLPPPVPARRLPPPGPPMGPGLLAVHVPDPRGAAAGAGAPGRRRDHVGQDRPRRAKRCCRPPDPASRREPRTVLPTPALTTGATAHPIRRGAAGAGRAVLAVALLAAIFSMVVWNEAARTLEATAVRPLFDLVTPGGSLAVGDRLYYNLGAPGRPYAVGITAMCSVTALLVPLFALAAFLVAVGRFRLRRAIEGLVGSVLVTFVSNALRLGMLGYARDRWGMEGFDVAHHLVGAVFGLIGFAAGVLVLVRAGARD